ncbi:hypothetical protein R5R35_012905 [Gryllus longicercus]|uniref:PHD-type domain-containing protein n=1 Tax=Gryllus longicercus TaxID=2509291 RepID=A0AAN9VNH3_9ORTH
MAEICCICEESVDENGKFFECDSCKRYLHVICAELTASEVKCLELRKRVMSFFCVDCKSSMRSLPQLLAQFNKLSLLVDDLTKRLDAAESNQRVKSNDDDELAHEISERVLRKNNLIVYNVTEPNTGTIDERSLSDVNTVLENFKKCCDFDSSSIVKVFRLGKFRDNINRPIKVIFSNAIIPLNILKNKNICANSVKIVNDLTLMQRNKLKSLRSELDVLNKDSEIKTIRYIQGQPRIVDIKKGNKNNSSTLQSKNN